MARRVKRKYDGARRATASAETRQRIIDAARDLLLATGYRATTVSAIAQRADVSVATVYELVGRKPAIVRELIEQAISGTDQAVAAEDRDYVMAIKAETGATDKLELYARAVVHIQQRMAPLFVALRDAATTDADALAVWNEVNERRAANMSNFARDLKATGHLRPGLRVDDVADTVWAMASADMYLLFTVERGWPPAKFSRWLADAWCRLFVVT
ncbi:MAG: TetR/AcrR family transcriptional regulator [Acidimicrobiia bacterium]